MIRFSAPIRFDVGNSVKQLREVTADEIVAGWRKHASGDPFTKFLEHYARGFIEDGLPDEMALLLVRMVCAWVD